MSYVEVKEGRYFRVGEITAATYYDVNYIKFIQSERMRILKELYNNVMDKNEMMLTYLNISKDNYSKSKAHFDYLADKGFIEIGISFNLQDIDKKVVQITSKGIDEIEKYMIENAEYVAGKYTAFTINKKIFEH